MYVLITGVAGFIGSHLAERYLAQDHIVIGVDDFSSSDEVSQHLDELRKHRNFRLIKESVESYEFQQTCIDAIPQGSQVLILNFACPASPPLYQLAPLKTLNTCYLGTKNVLELARHFDARVIHASTSEIYGDPLTSPQVESDWGNVNSFGKRSCYDEGKRAAETLCWIFLHDCEDPVDVRIIRIFNTAGPNMDPYDGRVISNFMCQAIRNEKLTIYGDGSQTRSFCYIDDLVDAIELLANLDTNPELPINLGNPVEFSMNELAERVIQLINPSGNFLSCVKYKKLPEDDPRQRRPNIDRAKELLNWEPKVDLDEALRKMLPYFQKVAHKPFVKRKRYQVYCHTSKTSGKCYVGYTGNSMMNRWNVHLKHVRNGSKMKFHNAIRKYGVDDWTHKILFETNELAEAKSSEIEFISKLNSYHNGYNMTMGGDGCPGACHQKGRKFSDEHRAKLSFAKLSPSNPHRGKKRSKQTRERMREAWTVRRLNKTRS